MVTRPTLHEIEAAPAPVRPPALTITEHVRRTIVLAWPVMLARAGMLVMTAVDTIMCGRVSAEQLAYYGIAVTPHLAFLLGGIGLLMGTVIVTAQTDGAGHAAACGRIWRLALVNAAVVGTVFGLLMLPGEQILRGLGQSPAIAAGGGEALAMFALGMPGVLLFVASSAFLEGIGRPAPGMVVMLLANLLNILLNALLMFGPFELGAVGAALATSITRWFMCFALLGYILVMRAGPRYGVRAPMAGFWRYQGRLVGLGWPLALSMLLEHGAFFAAATFAGWLGAVSLAAYQIVLNTVGLIYMLAIGIATATGVRVGNAVGRGDADGLAKAGWVGLAIGIAVMLAIMPPLQWFSHLVVALYTNDAAVALIAMPSLMRASWILVADASQGILTGALRGAGDVRAPLLIQFASFWLIAIPVCYLLALQAEDGVTGLLNGLFCGLLTAALLLAWRFGRISRRPIRPL